jgi:hypothetical protein
MIADKIFLSPTAVLKSLVKDHLFPCPFSHQDLNSTAADKNCGAAGK